MKHLWFHIGALTVTATACACLLWRNRAEKRKGGEQDALLSIIASGIAKNAAIFDGLYESLYLASHDERQLVPDAYEEWCGRAAQLEDAAFCRAFSQLFCQDDLADAALCRAHMALLLSCIDRAGIRRAHESGATCPAGAALRRAYLTIDGSAIAPDAPYTVLKPAWLRGDQIVEYGMLLPCAKHEEGDFEA